MTDNSFKKVGQSENRLYGPRKILLCGYTAEDQDLFRNMLSASGIADVALVVADIESQSITLKDIFARPDESGIGLTPEMQRTVIMAGVREQELHTIINAYRSSGLPQQFWATLTPISENWKLIDLLEDLRKENEALRKRQQDSRKTN